jgi:hypothetical protein
MDPITLQAFFMVSLFKNNIISIELIKYAPLPILMKLVDLINCWKLCHVIDEWRLATMNIFHYNNYQGIGLLSICYTIYAEILAHRISKITDLYLWTIKTAFEKIDPVPTAFCHCIIV